MSLSQVSAFDASRCVVMSVICALMDTVTQVVSNVTAQLY